MAALVRTIRVVDEKEGGCMTKVSHKKRRWLRWTWPLGLIAAAGGAAVFLLRGCWHTRMGWPIREGEHSYQVCLECGIKRLFDEKKFRGYGPYGYDAMDLMARERAVRMRQRRKTA
jgi:hypothetical protein